MKNVILGVVSCLLIIYTTMLTLSVYSVYARKNEVDRCLSSALKSAIDRYYMPTVYEPGTVPLPDDEIEFELVNDIEDRLNSDSEVDTQIYVCDMEKGIISAQVEEAFRLPMGLEKTISCTKTIIVDREEK